MGQPQFVHLHVHTDYSLLDGACETSELFDEASRQKMPSVSITDHGNMFAAAKFFYEASKRDVKPIIGCEVYVAKGSRHDRGEKTNGSNGQERGDGEPGTRGSNHLVLLCESLEGYHNLIKLVSSGFLEGFYYKPRIDYDLLSKHSKGLIALSACLRGPVTEAVVEQKYDLARENAYRLRDLFGKGNFFLEIQDQGLEIEKGVKPELVRLSKETGIPLVATNDCHYLHHDDAHAQEVLLCIQTGKTMSDAHRMKFQTDQFYFKSAAEMAQVFGELPDALSRTVDIAQRCNVKIERIPSPFPEFKVPAGHTAGSYFEKVVREGFASRLPILERQAQQGMLRNPLAEYEKRLTSELEMIQKMRYEGYFLIIWDFIHYARTQDVPVGPGRGSAAGSLVSYALRITDVDPLQYNLLFERFLNPERISMPDIDIDFCMRRRGELIEYVTQKYGRENLAQIITVGTMAAKASIKDVGRDMDIPYMEVDRLAKLVPTTLGVELETALAESPQLKAAVNSDERLKDLMAVALRLEGLARHASTHAAGVVISPRPLTDVVPVYKTSRDEITTQYDMNALERIGLLKMDFLGLTTLTVLHDTVRMIEQNRGVKIDLDTLALDDADTYKLFTRGDTTAIFQFESHGMRDILRRYQPTRIEDLTALNALYRPGPIQGGMIDDFIDRKHGRKRIEYELAELKEILEETLGVIVYQEQVMQIANRLAGYSLGEADLLRRAMGKKIASEMAAQRESFVTGANQRGYPPKKIEKIFDLMAQFAGYGFNKSHSAAYALLAYQTAYLKTRYPVEFMAALLTSVTGSTDDVVKYINECREMGIAVEAPDINVSDANFTPHGSAIRFGLAAVKNVGHNAIESIVAGRKELGRYTSIYEFCEKVDLRLLNKRVLESLIKSGAMDGLGRRAQLMAVLDRAIEGAQKTQRDAESGQHGLFGVFPQEEASASHNKLPDTPDWDEHTRLANEKEILGFFISGHPLEKYRDKLEDLCALSTEELATMKSSTGKDETITTAGIISNLRVLKSKRGDFYAQGTLEDRAGSVEMLVFPEAYRKLQEKVKLEVPVLVRGGVRIEEGANPKLTVNEIHALEDAKVPLPHSLRIRIPVETSSEGTVDALHTLCAQQKGAAKVLFDVERQGDFMVLMEAEGYNVLPDRNFIARVEELCGRGAVRVID